MLTDRFTAALVFAEQAHRTQRRKGSGVPYIAHLLSVSALVLEHGGDEDQAIAALLHDAVEDQGGLEMAQRIRAEFGDRVADMVLACTDTVANPKPPWAERKKAYIAKLPGKSADALLVSLADKLHNATAILNDHALHGAAVWDRFIAGRDGTLWYYRELANAFAELGTGPMSKRLGRVVDAIEAAAEVEEGVR